METKPIEEKENYIKKILTNITFIFALIIFISFLVNYVFYKNFDIHISNYSSIYELLFYFITGFLVNPIDLLTRGWFIIIILLAIFVITYNIKFKNISSLIYFFKSSHNYFLNICNIKDSKSKFLKFIYFSLYTVMILFSFIIFDILNKFFNKESIFEWISK